MSRSALGVVLAAVLIAVLRVIAAQLTGPWWGVNAVHYLTRAQTIAFITVFFLALAPAFFRLKVLDRRTSPRPLLAAMIGAAAWMLLSLLPAAATPLLGDGIDRVEATGAGLATLARQPAPLDILIHWAAFKLWIAINPGDAFLRAWQTWRAIAYLCGGLAAAAAAGLAGARARTWLGRGFIFLTCLATGAVLFYMGYVENYVTLAAALAGFILLADRVFRGRAPVWGLAPAIAVLIGLHYFMVLLAPALLITLYRHRIWRPSRAAWATMIVAATGFGVMAAMIVIHHYRGLSAIFEPPGMLLSAYHLIGFVNQMLLASPALPLLALLLIWKPGPRTDDPLLNFLGLAGLTLVGFFFALRPVLGPAADWDLYAVPALVFTPWLALRVQRAWEDRPEFSAAAWATAALLAISVGPWCAINLREAPSLTRLRDLMEWEAPHNDFAASFGYYRMGKWLLHSGRPGARREIQDVLDRAIEINPDSATLRGQAAQVLEAIGETALAARQMAAHHRLMGDYHRGKKDFAAAEQDYQRALDYQPGDPEALGALIALYRGPLADPAQAEKYQRLLDQTP
jgi:hypothetical protein